VAHLVLPQPHKADPSAKPKEPLFTTALSVLRIIMTKLNFTFEN